MILLNEVHPPSEDIILIQPQVNAYADKNFLGQGLLYLTLRKIVWICDRTQKGFVLMYPAIAVHATSTSNEDFPDPCLFLVIDIKKTDIEYIPDLVEEEENTDLLMATIRFVPLDSSIINELYKIMNDCQVQNPEIGDEMNDSSEEDDEELENEGNEDVVNEENERDFQTNGGEWYTADNIDDEIYLSAEGRANLERIIGNLSEQNNSATLNGYKNSKDDTQMDDN